MRTLSSWIAALPTMLSLGLACASSEPLPVAERPRLLVVPANFDYKTPESLVPGVEIVAEALRRYATEQGFVCETLALATVLDDWEPAIHEVGGLIGDDGRFEEAQLERARGALARRLVAEGEVEGVLFTTVELKLAGFNSKGNRAVWDGASQLFRVGGGSNVFDRRELKVQGSVPVTSLWTALYDPAGELLGSGRAGLEIMQWLNIVDRESLHSQGINYYYVWTDRDDLFEDAKRMQWAIERAMRPTLEAAPRRR